MTETVFILQPYRAKLQRLVALPAQVFEAEADARSAAARLARFRDGIVVAAQTVDRTTTQRGRPDPVLILGRVPTDWTMARAA